MDWLNNALAFFENALTHAHGVSILIGLLIACGFTQWAKFPIRLYTERRGVPVSVFKFVTRTVSAATGLAVTWFTWPEPGAWGFLWGCVTGFFSPLVYTGTMRALAHFWPWLADKASTDVDDTDEAGV